MPQNKPLDHLVYAVPDLDAAIDDFEARLGVRAIAGGYHPTQGTKNALINLGQGAYLELIAKDPDNHQVPGPVWMGLDYLTMPRLTRWAIKSTHLDQDVEALSGYNTELAHISEGSRNTTAGKLLRWSLTLPAASPEVELVPFLIDWSQSEEHPTEGLPDMGCSFVSLTATHPDPSTLLPTILQLGSSLAIAKGVQVNLQAVIRCPKGDIVI